MQIVYLLLLYSAGDIKDLKILASHPGDKDDQVAKDNLSPVHDSDQLGGSKQEQFKWHPTHSTQASQECSNQESFKISSSPQSKLQYHQINQTNQFRTVKHQDENGLGLEVQPSTPKPHPSTGEVYSYSSHSSMYR